MDGGVLTLSIPQVALLCGASICDMCYTLLRRLAPRECALRISACQSQASRSAFAQRRNLLEDEIALNVVLGEV
jgi:hypothetical protein